MDVARKVIKIYKGIKQILDLFGENGVILLADYCEFRPGQEKNCAGGA